MMKKQNALPTVSHILEAVVWPLSVRAAAIIGFDWTFDTD
jgi:hypothetical protein